MLLESGTKKKFTELGSVSVVNAIYALDPSNVYIGGQFTSAGGDLNIRYITMWNGKNFTKLGTGIGGRVKAIYALDKNHVYIGGQFTSAGGDSNIRYITMWDGNTFTKLKNGNELTDEVTTIYALDENHVYIGGQFISVGGNATIKYVTMWNEATFVALSGIDKNSSLDYPYLYTIHGFDENHIYVGGNFRKPSNKIAMWNGF